MNEFQPQWTSIPSPLCPGDNLAAPIGNDPWLEPAPLNDVVGQEEWEFAARKGVQDGKRGLLRVGCCHGTL